MILGVNGIRLIGKRSGVGRCIEAFLSCAPELDHPFTEIRVYTPEPIGSDIYLPPCAVNVVLPSALPLAAWEQFTMLKAHGNKDLLFCPSYVMPLAARCPTFLVHHGSYEGFPEAFDWWTLNKARAIYCLSAHRASAVSTVSEHSKRDMVHYYKMKPEKIHVVPEGVDTRLFNRVEEDAALSEMRRKQFGKDVPFILYVGKPVERRNLSPLVRAFALLKNEDRIPHKLFIVGSDQPGHSPFRKVIEELRLQDDVSILGYASHQQMRLIYNAADVLVYPSSYEGFGMPVLEGMACGTPVITLNNTAFPEFAGGVAHLIKDASVATLRSEILSVISNKELQEQMRRDGPKRAAAYDWRLVIRRYLDLMIPLATATRPLTVAGAQRRPACQ
jgi:glycosyltransferase involved in cell wall biosynthesis